MKSLITSSEIKLALACGCILMAGVFDALDGMTARYFKVSSIKTSGHYLDSLADMVSFGVAPAVLFYAVTLFSLQLTPINGSHYNASMFFSFALSNTALNLFSIVSASLFPLFAITRLANNQSDYHHQANAADFRGCPTTIAASFLVLILTFNFLPSSLFNWSINFFHVQTIFSNYSYLFFMYLLLTLIMLLPIPFIKLSAFIKKRSKSTIVIITLTFVLLLFAFFKYTLLILSMVYVVNSIIAYVMKKLINQTNLHDKIKKSESMLFATKK